jgi:hypothetical protein
VEKEIADLRPLDLAAGSSGSEMQTKHYDVQIMAWI